MAGRSSSLSMVAAHRLFAPAPHVAAGDPAVELDEADVIWGGGAAVPSSSSPVDPYGLAPSVSTQSKPSKPRGAAARDAGGSPGRPASLPVNIPDWSKILGAEYGGSGRAGAGRWPSDERGDSYLDGGEDARVSCNPGMGDMEDVKSGHAEDSSLQFQKVIIILFFSAVFPFSVIRVIV